MARVAIVESYPYEAVWGGDAVYLDRIRTYLTDQRHSVLSYVTDIARGRTNPLLKLRSKAGARNDWIVRNAIAQGGGRFLAYDTRLLRRALTRMPGRRAPQEFGIGQGEQAWLIAQLERARAIQTDKKAGKNRPFVICFASVPVHPWSRRKQILQPD